MNFPNIQIKAVKKDNQGIIGENIDGYDFETPLPFNHSLKSRALTGA